MAKILEDIHQSDGLVWNQQLHSSSIVLETQSMQEKKSWN